MSVTGHRNEGSITSYVRQLSLQQCADMCGILHSYGKETTTSGALVPLPLKTLWLHVQHSKISFCLLLVQFFRGTLPWEYHD